MIFSINIVQVNLNHSFFLRSIHSPHLAKAKLESQLHQAQTIELNNGGDIGTMMKRVGLFVEIPFDWNIFWYFRIPLLVNCINWRILKTNI